MHIVTAAIPTRSPLSTVCFAALSDSLQIKNTFEASALSNFKQIHLQNDRFHAWDNLQRDVSGCVQ